MKTIIDRASSRGFFDHSWLKTNHTFSFADYYNPRRMHFGALRVLNEDTVAPSMGFDLHPHANMEVVSIPLSGYLRHGDSEGHSQTLTAGDIQVMSAGRGIFHSEYNGSDRVPVEFLQIWVIPREKDGSPQYGNYDIRDMVGKNEFSLFLSPDGQTPASIRQDAWFSMGHLAKGGNVPYRFHKAGTGVYLFVIEGSVKVAGETLHPRDGMGVWDAADFSVEALEDSRVLALEVPMEF